jgi:hypothetical protein
VLLFLSLVILGFSLVSHDYNWYLRFFPWLAWAFLVFLPLKVNLGISLVRKPVLTRDLINVDG